MPKSPTQLPTRRSPLAYGRKVTPARLDLFLECLATGMSPAKACEATDLGYSTMYVLRQKDTEFARRWAEAVEHGVDLLEDECRRRAFEGVERPVYQGGARVGSVTEYSDTLAVMLMKGRRKSVFSERVEQTGPNGGPIQHEIEVTFVRAEDGRAK